MTTLALFLAWILVIMGAARYLKSNTFFWTMLTGLTLSFCIAALYSRCSNKEESETKLTQAYPTQGLSVMSETAEFLLPNMTPITHVKVTSKPVSQVITPDYCELPITQSVCGVTHEQYFHVFPNPPNSLTPYDTS